MFKKRIVVLAASAMIVLTACGGGGASPSAGATTGGATTAPSEAASPSAAAECKVGISWNNFQQPRWAATDKPAMFAAIEGGGGTVVGDPDANQDNQRQLTDVDTLISQGAQVLILLGQDKQAILPAVQKAKDNGIPVIAYDRLIDDPDVLYITFDNIGVGKAEAEAILAKVPTGNYVLVKGDPGDANASTFLPLGWDQAGLKDKIASGDIKIVGPAEGAYTNGWDTATAQKNVEAIIDRAVQDNVKIDAFLAENDSTALGVVRALEAKNYGFPPVSGQDGDPANLNNLALGKQYVDVWKNSNELGKAAGQAALQLCAGTAMGEVTVDVDASVAPLAGNTATDFVTPGPDGKPDTGDEITVKSIILQPTPLLAEDLDKVTTGWYATKEDICKGVQPTDPGGPDCQ
ncbi:MAG: substrate-binding domain-containing protein [Candidatus Limnocylindrales bacterium]